MDKVQTSRAPLAFWRDERLLRVAGQAIFVLAVGLVIYFLLNNMLSGLKNLGMSLGFSFLGQVAGFDIGETLINYDRSSIYLRAFFVGLLNTLLVSLVGIFFSTLLGILVGVARLSSNFLVNRIARVYIEVIRNVPLLVLLVFWYTGVFLKLPRVKQAEPLPGSIYLTNRGVAIPWGIPGENFTVYLWILGGGLIVALLIGIWVHYLGKRRESNLHPGWWGLAIFLLSAVIGWFALAVPPLSVDYPFVKGLNLAGGLVLSPEYMALLSGLVIYTAAFIGEVVRAGIQAVPKGQIEASKALGLSPYQALRLIVFPQALRVIIPPLTSQYLNLTKNSSLAAVIGYADVFYVSGTIINQSGRAVEMIFFVMMTYLLISVITSFFMNWYNRKTAFVER